MLEHLTKEIQEVKENYTDHMTELFFLQVRFIEGLSSHVVTWLGDIE